ncbi:MAG: ATP-binding protein [Clostridia bacterium]|nr:ATP-binding protein [Clostridia bacterium]
MKTPLENLRTELCSFVLLRNIANNGPLKLLRAFLDAVGGDKIEITERYCDFVSSVYEHGCDLGTYIEDSLRCDDNAYVRLYSAGREIPLVMKDCFERELYILSSVTQITSDELISFADINSDLPHFISTPKDLKQIMKNALSSSHKNGYGIYARYGMFRVGDDGALLPVLSPDPIALSDLVGYDDERNKVLCNTKALLRGAPAANVLLVGDAGTGKSSTVKAVANELKNEGIRLIELRKDQLTMLPDIMGHIAENPLKFIIFIDDLSFASEDDGFAALKAILEGSAAAKTPNAVIYATSNRRHMVHETFSAREGDEVHLRDTLEETLSLSARFGLTILFTKPNSALFKKIVTSLARERGIEMNESQLMIQAEAFALAKGGRSARVAGQFIDSLIVNSERNI